MRHQAITITLLLSIFLTGCQPDDVDPPAGPCRIKSAQPASGKEAGYIFTYGSDGRVTQYANGDSIYYFTYNGNTVSAEMKSDGATLWTGTLTLNNNGFITNIRTGYTPYWENSAYEYSGDQVMKLTKTSNYGSPSIETYTWSNGNLVKSNTANEEFTYEYDLDKSAMDGDYDWLFNSITGGKIIRSKNLLKKINYPTGGYGNITYEYDAEGKITAITVSNGGTNETILYTYECN